MLLIQQLWCPGLWAPAPLTYQRWCIAHRANVIHCRWKILVTSSTIGLRSIPALKWCGNRQRKYVMDGVTRFSSISFIFYQPWYSIGQKNCCISVFAIIRKLNRIYYVWMPVRMEVCGRRLRLVKQRRPLISSFFIAISLEVRNWNYGWANANHQSNLKNRPASRVSSTSTPSNTNQILISNKFINPTSLLASILPPMDPPPPPHPPSSSLQFMRVFNNGTKAFDFFLSKNFQYSSKNALRIMSQLHPVDVDRYQFDAKKCDWGLLMERCFLGLRRYYFKESYETTRYHRIIYKM